MLNCNSIVQNFPVFSPTNLYRWFYWVFYWRQTSVAGKLHPSDILMTPTGFITFVKLEIDFFFFFFFGNGCMTPSTHRLVPYNPCFYCAILSATGHAIWTGLGNESDRHGDMKGSACFLRLNEWIHSQYCPVFFGSRYTWEKTEMIQLPL